MKTTLKKQNHTQRKEHMSTWACMKDVIILTELMLHGFIHYKKQNLDSKSLTHVMSDQTESKRLPSGLQVFVLWCVHCHHVKTASSWSTALESSLAFCTLVLLYLHVLDHLESFYLKKEKTSVSQTNYAMWDEFGWHVKLSYEWRRYSPFVRGILWLNNLALDKYWSDL